MLSYDKVHELLVVSKCSSSFGNANERPSGIVKVSLLDSKNMPFFKIHDQPIKDLKCSQRSDSLVLSTSQDKTLKITNLVSGAICHTFHLDQPGWSCSWDPVDPNAMLVGLQNNVVLFFDIRKTSTFLRKLEATRRGPKPLPIHSLAAIRGGEGANAFPRGVLVGTPENIFFWSLKDGAGYQMSFLEHENVPGEAKETRENENLGAEKGTAAQLTLLPFVLVGFFFSQKLLLLHRFRPSFSDVPGVLPQR